ncbi:ChaN family lipoprotein [Falsiroseomonas sp.]|uniref:ChaN family lipoprotein n=1 Tax=Falsiroseomonas sp. TaxID=2870721 RepID=UPI00271CC023|nr:ChaN family lipoprotein [Falsiroseomonas sp.]MDO9499917.1 ChaN family lipoprotein [Falsiroseomonas sp.]
MTTIPHPRARWMDPCTGALLDMPALMRRLATRQAVLLGETHDVAEIHRWQLQVTTCLHLLRPDLAVGFEMFPRRVQPVLDRWVAGGLRTAEFLQQVEWEAVWGFPPEIYLPLFHFCRQQAVPMLALNCHRPLVTRVGQEGWDAVPEEDRDGLTPAAPPTAGHRGYIAKLTGRAEAGITDRFLRAQQVWDRAFACNIARHIAAAEGPAPLVIGIIGRGHLDYGHGTPHQLRDLGILDVAVLAPTEAAMLDTAEMAGIAEAVFRLDRPEEPVARAPKG